MRPKCDARPRCGKYARILTGVYTAGLNRYGARSNFVRVWLAQHGYDTTGPGAAGHIKSEALGELLFVRP